MPPTELIVSVGKLMRAGVLFAVIGPRVFEVEAVGVVAATVPKVTASRRMTPGPPGFEAPKFDPFKA